MFVAAAGVVGFFVWKASRDLPDYESLAKYEPPVMTRIHAHDGSLMAEYARERRIFVPINVVPKRVIAAYLSAEDKRFYEHGGLDFTGIGRAGYKFITNILNRSDRRTEGASTITQQVAKNFLLSSDRTLERKLKEAILAIRIERAYSKDKILELYLNEIYLGMGSYGVAAAALNYFNKELRQLEIEEAAYLAALPKAPNNYHPFRKAREATIRRNWIIDQMADTGDDHRRRGQARQGQAAQGQHPPARHADLCGRLLRRGRAPHAGRTTSARTGSMGARSARPPATGASTAGFRCAPRSIPTCSAWRARR